MTSSTGEDTGARLIVSHIRERAEVLEKQPDALTCVEIVGVMRLWAEDALREYVAQARDEGCGWDAIAAALGVSRQAAWQRFRTEADDTRRSHGMDDHLRSDEIWSILTQWMRPGYWYELTELYTMVQTHTSLTEADLEPDAPDSNSPRWQRNVRNVLQRRKARELQWDGRGRYCMQ